MYKNAGKRYASKESIGSSEADIYRVTIGPVSPDMVMKMSALTRDYHPCQLIEEAAAQRGLPALELHPAWIAGLVDMGIRSWPHSGRIAMVGISYLRPVYQGDTLIVELVTPKDRGRQGETALPFRVRNQQGGVAAEGTALIDFIGYSGSP